MPCPEPWYVAAFQRDYLEVYPHRDLESARAEVAYVLARGVAGRVLDLCCGFGRHSLALLERGVDVYGVDLSADLLQHAAELPGPERLAGRLVRGDARRLPFAARSFDGLVNMFSSFGYFGAEGDRRVLDEIARVLRPRGRAVLDLMNPARIRAGLVPASREERDGMTLEERRELVEGGGRVRKRVEIVFADGRRRSWTEDVRLYEPEVLRSAAGSRGLRLERVDGGFDGEPFGPAAERQILHLTKDPESRCE